MSNRPKPLVLLILDGFGYAQEQANNTIAINNQPHTAHVTNLVPLVYVGGDRPLAENGSLSDLAPPLLDIMGIAKPLEMTGRSLLKTA